MCEWSILCKALWVLVWKNTPQEPVHLSKARLTEDFLEFSVDIGCFFAHFQSNSYTWPFSEDCFYLLSDLTLTYETPNSRDVVVFSNLARTNSKFYLQPLCCHQSVAKIHNSHLFLKGQKVDSQRATSWKLENGTKGSQHSKKPGELSPKAT